MKIVDMNDKPVRACAYFNYKGFDISSSSIMSQRSLVDSICVWDEHGNEVSLGKRFDTVEQAIEFVNEWQG